MLLRFDEQIRQSLEVPHLLEVTDPVGWHSAYPVTEVAVMSVGSVAAQLCSLLTSLELADTTMRPSVNARLASLWFGFSIQPQNWTLPPVWDEFAGDYQTSDGWLRLHTNLPHHRLAALSVLGNPVDRRQTQDAVRDWQGEALEQAIVAQNGVCAVMSNEQDWLQHIQGRTLQEQPLVHWHEAGPMNVSGWRPTRERPLAGLRVLDLTRVLAGPVATRTLAGLGAKVLRIDPPQWDEPNVVPDISIGKRCARLDLKSEQGRRHFSALLADAHILVHGYRGDALEALGMGKAWRQAIAPSCLEVTLNAYGWEGPWQNRRGFDSLVQMSCGIAAAGMDWAQSDKPHPLPVQALDHGTGYLMAAAVLQALHKFVCEGKRYDARLSLARTALWLTRQQRQIHDLDDLIFRDTDYADESELTDWGRARRLEPPFRIEDSDFSHTLRWVSGACELGRHSPHWTDG